MNRTHFFSFTLCGAALLAATSALAAPFSQSDVPTEIHVPAGNKIAFETVGSGDITYECKQAASGTEWVFAGPNAILKNRSGEQVGIYYGPPATWEANDGSRLTATQLATAPAGAQNLPYQLVKANPAIGQGKLTGVTFIQRVALQGGVAPKISCNVGERTKVTYKADYIFWKAN